MRIAARLGLVAALLLAACSSFPRTHVVHDEVRAGTHVQIRADGELPSAYSEAVTDAVVRALDLLSRSAPEQERLDDVVVHVLSEENFARARGRPLDQGPQRGGSVGGFTLKGRSPLIALRRLGVVPDRRFVLTDGQDAANSAAHEATHAWLNHAGLDGGAFEEGLSNLVAESVRDYASGIDLLSREVVRGQTGDTLRLNRDRFPWDRLETEEGNAEYYLATAVLSRVQCSNPRPVRRVR